MCLSLGGTDVLLVMALCSVFGKVLLLSAKTHQVLVPSAFLGARGRGQDRESHQPVLG